MSTVEAVTAQRVGHPSPCEDTVGTLSHRLTNAGLEAVNATIQGVKKTARGFRNVEDFKAAIYFRGTALDLYPHEIR